MYIDSKLESEINYFEKKYNFKIEFVGSPSLIVPEYKIHLLTKNKKIVNKVENINKLENLNLNLNFNEKKNKKIVKLESEKKVVKTKKKTQKNKSSAERTLWVRKKKVS